MADEDERESLPDLRPTKIVWSDGGITVTAQQFAGAIEVGPYNKTIEMSDPRLTREQRDVLIAAMRVVASVGMDIKPKPGGASVDI